MKILFVFFLVLFSTILPDAALANEGVVQVKISTHFKGEVIERSAIVGLGDSIKLTSSQGGMVIAIDYVIKPIQANGLDTYSISAVLYSGIEGSESWSARRDIFAVVEKSVPAFFSFNEAPDEMQIEVNIASIENAQAYLRNIPRKPCDLSLESPNALKSQRATGFYGCCTIACQDGNGICCGAVMCCIKDPRSYPVWLHDSAYDCCCYPPRY